MQQSNNSSGIVVCNKMPGITSMDVVRIMRRATGLKRIGHGGTLDPIASGVLPVFIGQATRVSEYILDNPKEYITVLCLGKTTDTYDADGEILQKHDYSSVSRETFSQVLPSYTGHILQKPPMYSALKVEGKRLYKLARSGVEVERVHRSVVVSFLDVTEWNPPFVTLHVKCGRGVYIRSLVHDLGQSLGCGAHVVELTRVKIGNFSLDEALCIDNSKEEIVSTQWKSFLKPMDSVLISMPAYVIETEQEVRLRSGEAIELINSQIDNDKERYRRIYNRHGYFVGIVRPAGDTNLWKPQKIFAAEEPSTLAPSAT
jgi:tRNA pseudouridine55 synthase|tara:strand:+ start:5443 stop:6387 length:945 start_codon:yes stop_codon:yes gene_type:complete